MPVRTSLSARPRSRGMRVSAAVAATVPLLLGALAQAGPASAGDDRTLMTFDNDGPYDEQVSSFTSPDRPDLEFCAVDLPNGKVSVYSYSGTYYSNALFASYDFGMKFAAPIDSLEMSFGGDEPSRVSTNAEAVLTLFLGHDEVGQQKVAVNSNHLVDQQIATAGTTFNRATLQYVDATNPDAEYTSMVIDNLKVGQPVVGAANPATTCKNPSSVDPVDPVDPDLDKPRCTVTGTKRADTLMGTKHDDVICGFGGDDVLKGRGGDDIVRGHDGDDVVRGGQGRDFLAGGRGHDRGNGGPGVDFAVTIERLSSARAGK